MLINPIMLNVNALEMERKKKPVSNTHTAWGRMEGFANHTTQVNSLLNISHTYKDFWVFLGSSLLPTWGTLCSAGCSQAATGSKPCAHCLQLPWLGPSIPPAASLQPTSLSLHPAAASCPSPLATAASLDLETKQLGGICHFR